MYAVARILAARIARVCSFTLLTVLACGNVFAAGAVFAPGSEAIVLSGHVSPALARAATQGAEADTELSLTLTLRRDDEDGFQTYLHDVYDAHSPSYRQFLSPSDVADRFGPSQDTLDRVSNYFSSAGLQVIDAPANRMTLELRGFRSTVERALSVRVNAYHLDDRKFYANDRDPSLPGDIAASVQSISGLTNFATPRPMLDSLPDNPPNRALWYALCANEAINGSPINGGIGGGTLIATIFNRIALSELILWYSVLDSLVNIAQASDLSSSGTGAQYAKCVNLYNKKHGYGVIGGADPPPPAWQGADGTGQTIGLLEFDNYRASDIVDFVAFAGQSSGPASNVSRVDVNGGAAIGPNENEVLLDIADVLTAAPGAKVIVFDGAPSTSYQAMLNAMINRNVDIISNSWAYCENQTTLADVQSIDTILQTAAASGISVLTGAGDHGSTCLDGSANVASVPATSPHITAVGGTSLQVGPGFTYLSEKWWDSSTSTPPGGQGGFGVSRFFARPSYQNGLTSAAGRSIPDVSADADPANGVMICQSDAGGCPTGALYGGTSSSAPAWAAFTALLNQTQGARLGFLNPQIYPFAATDSFHSPASMGSDFAHVGLGSPNLARLHMRLFGVTPGAVSSTVSLLQTFVPTTYSPPPGAGPLPALADGRTQTFVVVTLVDANGIPVGGKNVRLDASAGATARFNASVVSDASSGTAIFYLKDQTLETLSLKATDTTDNIVLAQTATVQYMPPVSTGGSIVALTGSATADSHDTDTITVTLQDANGLPSPGKQVVLSHSGSAVVSPSGTVSSDANGHAVFKVSDTVQESVIFNAVDHTDNDVPVPGTASVAFNGGGGDGCGITTYDGNTDVKAAPGFAMTPYATGFMPLVTNFGGLADGCRGASGLAFDAAGNLFVSDLHSGNVYKFTSGGGIAGPMTLLTPTPLGPGLESLTFGKDGKLYGAQNATTGNFFTGAVIEINPTSGALVRTVASSITCASFIATDPISGDLFVNDSCAGNGSENGSLWRIANPGGPTPTSSVYAASPGVNGGVSIAPGGTIYMISYHENGNAGGVVRIAGTSAATPGAMTTVAGITGPALGIDASGTRPNGDATSLTLAAAPGTDSLAPGIRAFDITTATASTAALVVQHGFANVQVTGPDGCQYASFAVAVYKITNANGSCPLTYDGPTLTVTPGALTTNPAQGSSQVFTATLHHATLAAGTAVYFRVDGVNSGLYKASIDGTGQATFKLTGVNAGTDTIKASTSLAGTTLTSNPASVTWTSGPHATFLSLDGGPSGAPAGASVTLVATLLDETTSPFAPVSGASVQFAVNGQSCTATTDANGIARCAIVVKPLGSFTLTATFGGNTSYSPSSDSTLFTTRDLIFADGFEGLR